MKQLIVFAALFVFSQQFLYAQMITGGIFTYNNDPIQHVVVTLSTPTDTFVTVTGVDGLYQFFISPSDTVGTITVDRPTTGAEIQNGLTPYDMALIQKLAVGDYNMSDFSIYQLIAGDTNNDGYWSTYDAMQIYMLLIQAETTYANNPHWKFISADYEFDNSVIPILTEEHKTLQLADILNGSSTSFLGLRNGDVNGSAITYD